MSPLPLDDLRVLDLTHYYNGPYATLLLGYLGAEVIKVEPPVHGEKTRELMKLRTKAVSHAFATLNSNKRSITLNLKSDKGREIFKRLVERADIVVENFAPGAMARLGLGYPVLRDVNPRLVYATGTGYGLTGPNRELVAFDPVVQAMSGVMAVTGKADGPPLKAGPAVVDIMGGIHLAAGILAAIRQRDRTGKGLLVELALNDAIIPTLTTQMGAYYGLGLRQLRDGNRVAGSALVPYNAYPARDGWVMLLAGDEERWRRLCNVMGRTELADDPRFATNFARSKHPDEVDAAIAEWTKGLSRQELMDKMTAENLFCGIVKEFHEVMADPHLHERGMLRDIDHPQLGRITIFTSPLRLEGEAPVIRSPSPALGADNDEFYRTELGFDDEELARLRERKII
jgi:CoA:oxalate CoA-transferase